MSFHGYFFNPDKNFNIQTRKKVYIKERLQNAQPVAGKWHVTKWAYEFRFIPLRLTYLVTHFRTLLKNFCKTRLYLNLKDRHFLPNTKKDYWWSSSFSILSKHTQISVSSSADPWLPQSEQKQMSWKSLCGQRPVHTWVSAVLWSCRKTSWDDSWWCSTPLI